MKVTINLKEGNRPMTARTIWILAGVIILPLMATAKDTSAAPQNARAANILRNAGTAADYVDKAQAEKLLSEREMLVLKIHALRLELIKKDPRLRRMYEQLIQQARDLAMELESKKEMRNITESLGEIDSKLNRLQKK